MSRNRFVLGALIKHNLERKSYIVFPIKKKRIGRVNIFPLLKF